jgi:outer membrane protein assembly factor BamB
MAKTVSKSTTCFLVGVAVLFLTGADWARFRGPEGRGVAAESHSPVRWSATQNVAWKTPLPGPGSSSPIVVGDRIFVTCYAGYATGADGPGEPENLKRHLICVQLGDGKILWDKAVKAALPEQPYQSFITVHGYASSTPASDGHAVYVFFGRSGVYAFSLSGDQLWHAELGSNTHEWGSAASPILFENLVIVNACIESGALVALDRSSGKTVWRHQPVQESRSTPLVVTLPDGRHELVVSSRDRVLGLDPAIGQKRWECRGVQDYVCPAVTAHEDVVFITAGRKPHTLAIRVGGQGDVTTSRIAWEAGEGSKVPTPVYYEGHLYWVDHTGVAVCVNAQSGKTVYKQRLNIRARGDKVYASPVVAGGKIYVPTREDGVIVLAAEPEFKELARNRLDDPSISNATLAIAGDRLLARSNRFLYCVSQ